ncbi:DUF4352 domain-containing protein [Catellatospora sp. KI3]|uniref:DUF4352 domain-containing protein n=1 Tax=Catellatospora sp. KI3 TaxID=3041620 RepID=UPI002482AD75|nr:DUF4352 domain-containing protein [Catellatospora sp. KI3]MDI1464160.1 DUF4352 domain-containing protein [Catellatospora sp. KI3]
MPKQTTWGCVMSVRDRARTLTIALACMALLAWGSVDPPAAFSAQAETSTATSAVATSVVLTAQTTDFEPSVLYNGGDFTSVEVTVKNNGPDNVSVNPLSFTITASDGAKHSTELGEDANQIDTLTLAAGEHVTGAITAEGKFKPARVTFSPKYNVTVVADVSK